MKAASAVLHHVWKPTWIKLFQSITVKINLNSMKDFRLRFDFESSLSTPTLSEQAWIKHYFILCSPWAVLQQVETFFSPRFIQWIFGALPFLIAKTVHMPLFFFKAVSNEIPFSITHPCFAADLDPCFSKATTRLRWWTGCLVCALLFLWLILSSNIL